MKKILIISALAILYLNGFCQSKKFSRYFDNPVMIDTTNTILIPIRYNVDLLASNKMGLRNNYYANILITSPNDSTTRKLFETDTYILPLRLTESERYSYNRYDFLYSKSIFNNWIFMLVKNHDFNNNNEIDDKDPTILYLTDLYGNGLRKITNENENVIDYYVYEKQNLIMVKIQRDMNNNKKFTYKDKDFYFLFLDYNTLKEIKRVDI